MELLLAIGICVLGFVGLVQSANYLTTYSERVGYMFGMSSFIIGATIVAIGTSLPELVSVMYSVLGKGQTAFVADTSVGSNIVNICGVLGLGAIVARGINVKGNLADVDLPFFFSSMVLFILFAWDKVITRPEGIMLLGFFVIFVMYSMFNDAGDDEDKENLEKREEELGLVSIVETLWGRIVKREKLTQEKKSQRIIYYLTIVLISAVVLSFSAKYFIDNLISIAEMTGKDISLLTVVLVAIGTSLPEIVSSLSALKKGNDGIAIGNVFGSNTFNLTLIVGVPALFKTLDVSPILFDTAIPILIFVTLLTVFITFNNKVHFWEGVLCLFIYLIFLGKIVGIL